MRQILSFAQRNKRFAAIDRAISRNGLKFVTLLRLSPLLPLALSNWCAPHSAPRAAQHSCAPRAASCTPWRARQGCSLAADPC